MLRPLAISFVLLLVGCSAASTLPTSPNHVTTSLAPPPAGGPFSAGYSGSQSGSGAYDCLFLAKFNFSGNGTASFIHGSAESGSMEWSNGHSCAFEGKATITSTSHPRNSITVLLGPSAPPCRTLTKVDFKVLSGTGRFRNASGSGMVKFKCHTGGTYDDTWSGTLNF